MNGSGAVIDARAWWRSFVDPELDSLVERAIRSYPDIEIALDRLQEARNPVPVSVIADVARAYLDMRGLQMDLAAARQSVDTAQRR